MDLEVDRADLHEIRAVAHDADPLDDGQARLGVDAFALTSNNVTYAVFGDALQYWNFFPGTPDPDHQWGRIPVWGFADVLESRSPDLAVGERLYGYYPMSAELVIDVGRADALAVNDVAPHRAAMASTYSRYARTAADPLYRADREAEQMVLYPLFFTGFLLDDQLADGGVEPGGSLVVSSASSKTAISLAYLAHERGAHVIGLTSATNAAFVSGLGIYDEVITYDDLDRLAKVAAAGSAFVDIAGNADVVHAVHRRLADGLARSLTVGGTHWNHEADVGGEALAGPSPEFFFAPTRIEERTADWGAERLAAKVAEAWEAFTAWTPEWLELRRVSGAEPVMAVYRDLLDGHVDPQVGFVCSLAAAPS